MREQLRTESEFDAFLVDYFNDIMHLIPTRVDRLQRENVLLQCVGAAAILRALYGAKYYLAWVSVGVGCLGGVSLIVAGIVAGIVHLTPHRKGEAGRMVASSERAQQAASAVVASPERFSPADLGAPSAGALDGHATAPQVRQRGMEPAAGRLISVEIGVISTSGYKVTMAGHSEKSAAIHNEFGVPDASRATFKLLLQPGMYPVMCTTDGSPLRYGSTVKVTAEQRTYLTRCPE